MSAEPLRIHHVVSDIHRKDAGPSYSVPRLAEALSAHGAEVRIHALEPKPDHEPQVDTTYYKRSRLVPSIGVSEAMRRGLRSAALEADIMHFHGLWMMPNVYPGWAVRRTDCSLVMSPRGMLDPWALSWKKWRKALFGLTLQEAVINQIDCFHATSSAEADGIRATGVEAPIATIPIGVDLPAIAPRALRTDRLAIYLGRLHPVKNVEGLLRAWAQVESRHPDWSLTIAGPGEDDYVAGLRALARDLRVRRVSFEGATHGSEKAALLSAAELLVLPTFSESFGVIVAEALSYEIPVIATEGAPWNVLNEAGCGWWIPNTLESITATLNEALSLSDDDLNAMGTRGRSLVQRDYSWDQIGRSMTSVYRWLRSGGERPDCVRLD